MKFARYSVSGGLRREQVRGTLRAAVLESDTWIREYVAGDVPREDLRDVKFLGGRGLFG